VIIYDTLKAFLECGSAEINQETDFKIHQTKIGQELFLMDRCDFFNRL